MPISEDIAAFMNRYKEEHHLSIVGFSEELGISKNTVVDCLKGTGNLQSDTIDIIAEKCGVSVAEMISARPPGWERAEIVERAARLFSDLPPERQERAITHFLALIDILGDNA